MQFIAHICVLATLQFSPYKISFQTVIFFHLFAVILYVLFEKILNKKKNIVLLNCYAFEISYHPINE